MTILIFQHVLVFRNVVKYIHVDYLSF